MCYLEKQIVQIIQTLIPTKRGYSNEDISVWSLKCQLFIMNFCRLMLTFSVERGWLWDHYLNSWGYGIIFLWNRLSWFINDPWNTNSCIIIGTNCLLKEPRKKPMHRHLFNFLPTSKIDATLTVWLFYLFLRWSLRDATTHSLILLTCTLSSAAYLLLVTMLTTLFFLSPPTPIGYPPPSYG
jgi:hypothetical protein